VYEHRTQPLLSTREFFVRLSRHGAVAVAVLAFSLFLGMAGYHLFEKLSWLDAFLNSAMLLGGMGPVDPPKTAAGKLFAGGYALYAGLVFITVAAIVGTPLFHRILHRFHADVAENDKGRRKAPIAK
jgi:hypothetical protein